MGAGNVAISFFGPNLPELFNILVKLRIAGFGLENQALADNVADKGAYDRGHYVAVALQVPGPGPYNVTAVTVCCLCALVDGIPISVRASVTPGVVMPYFLKGLPPRLPLRSGLRVNPADQSV